MLSYISTSKLTEIWVTEHPEDKLNYRIFRTLCRYFMREEQVRAIATSKRLGGDSKLLHLKVRRQLLSLLEDHAS